MKSLNDLTTLVTAFRSWVEMAEAMNSGYVPTLQKRKKAQRELGQRLEQLGWRVFWI